MKVSRIAIDPEKKARLITVISIILGILFDYLFYAQSIGINFVTYLLLLIFVFLGFSALLKRHINMNILFLLLTLLFFGIMTFVRTSPLLLVANIGISLFLILLIAKISFGEKIKNFHLKDYISVPFIALNFINSLFKTLPLLFSFNKTQKKYRLLYQLLKGLFLSIPILFIFILLFSSADLIFQKYVSDVFSINIQPEIIIRLALVIAISLILVGAYSYIFSNPQKVEVIKGKKRKYNLGHVESSVILSSVNILFFLFIIIQFTYFFGGENNISSQGITYAEYARNGFFELIAVGILSLFLLLTIENFITKKKNAHGVGFNILSSILITQVGVVMTSAFMRLCLYEETYGFTTLRLYSHAFIIFLAVIFCLLVYKIFRGKDENSFLLGVFTCVLVFFAGMNLLNPDQFIAKQNIDRYTKTGKLDVHYLSNLSDDAIPEVIKFLNILENGDMKNNLGLELHKNRSEKESLDWQSFNVSKRRAMITLDSADLDSYGEFK